MAVKSSIKKSSKEPQTMDELLAQFEKSSFSLSVGNYVKGKVIGKEKGRLLLDIGGKSEGLVAEKVYKEAEDFIKTLEVGDEVEGRVLVTETPEGYTILSLREAVQNSSWEKIWEAYEKGEAISVTGKSLNPSGITVEIGGLNGFIPSSQLGINASKNPQKLIGKRFQAQVIEQDVESKKIVLSEKEVSEKEELVKARRALKAVKEGDIFEGEVTSVYDFGAFVRILVAQKSEKIPLEGLVHISEMSWDKVDRPSSIVSEGDKVKVKVIGKKGDKLALSIKRVQKDPWEEIGERFQKDQKVKGEVVKVSDFGVFVKLAPGVEGLIHITKIPPERRLSEGDKVDVYIEDVDSKEKRISLGLVLTEKPVGYK